MNNARLSSKVHYEASKEVQSLQVECSETNKPTLTTSEQLSSSDYANSQHNTFTSLTKRINVKLTGIC